jgi:hypothetical protein
MNGKKVLTKAAGRPNIIFSCPPANPLRSPVYGIPGKKTITGVPLSPERLLERSGIYMIGCPVF